MNAAQTVAVPEALKYFSIHLFVPNMLLGFWWGGGWAYVVPAIGFVAIPLLELFMPRLREESGGEETAGHGEALFSVALYLALPIQYLLLGTFLYRISFHPPGGWEWLGMVWTMGIACGVFGINVAHELGHRPGWASQISARLLYATVLYAHMLIHHNRAHHPWVGTPRDPNTARPGEPLFAFWARSIACSYLSAWRVEARRLRRRGRPVFSAGNEMLWGQPAQALLLGAMFYFFGAPAALSFLAAAAIGVLMLETINYIEHYGLLRRRMESGRFEKMGRHHAWNSDHLLGRILLFQVTRHSDHHLHPAREYQRLQRIDESPQMPTGYPGMMLLATVPPLFFRVVNPRLETVRQTDSAVEAPARRF